MTSAKIKSSRHMNEPPWEELVMSGQMSKSELTKETENWRNSTYEKAATWAIIYRVDRASVIIFSVLASADAVKAIPNLSGLTPVFALLVTLITAFDVWLKPETKYKAYYIANDDFDHLHVEISSLPDPPPDVPLRKATQEYKDIAKRLQAAIL